MMKLVSGLRLANGRHGTSNLTEIFWGYIHQPQLSRKGAAQNQLSFDTFVMFSQVSLVQVCLQKKQGQLSMYQLCILKIYGLSVCMASGIVQQLLW